MKAKKFTSRRLAILAVASLGVAGLGAWGLVTLSAPKPFTTTLDLAHKQILEDTTNHSWGDLITDIRSQVGDVSGTLLAAAGSRYIHVRSGQRKEEVADLMAEQLDWSEGQKLAFVTADEGTYYPGTYTVPSTKDEITMRELMQGRFKREVENQFNSLTKKSGVSNVVKLETILKVASLIEREAGSKSDMRLISGVIWNRIFKDMTLDIDATLQYAKADAASSTATSTDNVWWPQVLSADKKIISPYNTYKNKGLPPTPIASPADAAIDAALNPKKTDCLFYLHDTRRKIHCSANYEGHKKNIERYLK